LLRFLGMIGLQFERLVRQVSCAPGIGANWKQ